MVKAQCVDCRGIVDCNLNGVETKGIEITRFRAFCTKCDRRTERVIIPKDKLFKGEGYCTHCGRRGGALVGDLLNNHGWYLSMTTLPPEMVCPDCLNKNRRDYISEMAKGCYIPEDIADYGKTSGE